MCDMGCSEPTDAELSEIMRDFANLEALWRRFADDANASVPNIHPPPALGSLLRQYVEHHFEGLLEHSAEHHRVSDEVVGITFGDVALITLEMVHQAFQFGQLCERYGLRHADLFQCACGTLDDETAKKLLRRDDDGEN